MFRTISYIYAKVLRMLRGKAIKNCTLDKTTVVYSGSLIVNTQIGKYSYVGHDCDINATLIGPFCSIANNVVIGAAQHPIDWVSTSPVFEAVKSSGPKKRFSFHPVPQRPRTIIDADVWIGRNAIIMGGVRIGVGCIIGSGAVVTKDLEPYGIYAGVPARLIRYRFEKDTINHLLESKWWSLPDEQIQTLADVITNPIEFIERVKSRSMD